MKQNLFSLFFECVRVPSSPFAANEDMLKRRNSSIPRDTKMDSSISPGLVASGSKNKWARSLSKVLHFRVRSFDGSQKPKPINKLKDDKLHGGVSLVFDSEEEDRQNRVAMEVILAKVFACMASLKTAYAQMQISQSPYDVEGIQTADHDLITELKNLSELKQCFLKKQFDPSPEASLILAEAKEQKSLLKSFELTVKKLEGQLKLKESEAEFLRQKADECGKHNRGLEKKLDTSGQLSFMENLHLSGLNPTHFSSILSHTTRSVRSYARVMVEEMAAAGWDLETAASAIEPGIAHWRPEHRRFAFESYICREMMDGFQFPNFNLPSEAAPGESRRTQFYFDRFVETKRMKPMEFLQKKPKSSFAKFCRVMYLQVIHPKMETSFFRSLQQRSLVASGGYPETTFFSSFAEMARRVWMLHALAFSYGQGGVSVFQAGKGCRFSEVYMESVTDESSGSGSGSDSPDQRVAFTVAPGFRLGQTLIRCRVFLAQQQQ